MLVLRGDNYNRMDRLKIISFNVVNATASSRCLYHTSQQTDPADRVNRPLCRKSETVNPNARMLCLIWKRRAMQNVTIVHLYWKLLLSE